MHALTSTERSRRRRAHLRGNHSLCDPRRGCAQAKRPSEPAPPTGPVSSPPGAGLSERSRLLHDELSPGMHPLAQLLLVETLRVADRLDYFNELMAGKAHEWSRLQEEGDHRGMRVVVDDLLAEARQHGTALKTMLAELRQAPPRAPDPPAPRGGLADLTARIAARRDSPPAG